MTQKKQSPARMGSKSPSKNGRMPYALLSGVTLLIFALAMAAMLMEPALAPSHVASLASTPEDASLSRLETARTAKDAIVPLRAATPDAGSLADRQPAGPDLKATRAAEARQAAKETLVRKLARLRLAGSLLAAQAASKARIAKEHAGAFDIALASPGDPDTRAERSATVSALLGDDAQAGAETGIVAALEETAVAELEAELPSSSGTIVPPAPGIKPEPPRRAVAEPSKDKDRKAKAPVLAYATPGNPDDEDGGVFSGLGKLFGGGGIAARRKGVAIYDISAATVHMPDGTKLEAHSGIGHRMDNPKYAHVRMLGPTPPNVYKLRMRERRFHGVEAIRMLPYDRAAMKGRDGMLTHTRLLRNSIGSHGCVAFKDYKKFLTAFKTGKVKTMIVVPSMNKLPSYMAMLERHTGAS